MGGNFVGNKIQEGMRLTRECRGVPRQKHWDLQVVQSNYWDIAVEPNEKKEQDRTSLEKKGKPNTN